MGLRDRLSRTDEKIIAGAIAFSLACGGVALGAWITRGSDDGSATASPPASAESPMPASSTSPGAPVVPVTEPSRLGDDCFVNVNSVIVALDSATAADLPKNGLDFAALAPAQNISEGTSVAPEIARSENVRCDLRAGVVEMNGGFRFTTDTGGVNFDRLRIELDRAEVYAAFDSSGTGEFEALDITLDEAQFTDRGSIASAVVPMVLDADAAVALNAALGTDFLGDVIRLGTVTITGNWSDTPTEAP